MTAAHVFQLHISLLYITPIIWRRIQIKDTCSFWDLHIAIQNAMGWHQTHGHLFKVMHPISETVLYIQEEGDLLSWETYVKPYIHHAPVVYCYDLEDHWDHCITLEQVLLINPTHTYPRCMDGARACPPEEIGGPWGYDEYLTAIHHPNHPRYQELMGRLGSTYQPEYFESCNVTFDDPQTLLSVRKQIGCK